MSGHPIVHIEFSADNPEAAAKFYGDLFGWKISSFPEFNYHTFAAEPGPGGGFNPLNGLRGLVKAGDVVVYVETDDIDASLAKAESLGGKTELPKEEIPGQGWFAVFRDPTGNHVGLYTGSLSPAGTTA